MCIIKAFCIMRSKLDIILTNIELLGMEISLMNVMSREQTLKLYLEDLKKNYDYILIDCMPSLGLLTINALGVADNVFVLALACLSKLYLAMGKTAAER